MASVLPLDREGARTRGHDLGGAEWWCEMARSRQCAGVVASGLAVVTALAGMVVASTAAAAASSPVDISGADGAPGDAFGSAVSVSGSTAVVGAPDHAAGGKVGEGAAYVFTLTQGVWKQTAELTAPDGAVGDHFGSSVSVAGSNIVVGAPGRASGQGVAYAFTKSGATWVAAEMLANGGSAGDGFGAAVSVYSSTALVGAPGHAVGGKAGQGAAYTFGKSGSVWKQQAEIDAPDGSSGDAFGTSVALYSATAAIGAPHHDGGGLTDAGSGYVFTKAFLGSWKQQAELVTDAGPGGLAGTSIALYGSSLVLGAPEGHNGAGTFRAFARSGSGGSWSDVSAATYGIPTSDGAHAGFSVAISSSDMAIGAPQQASNNLIVQGAAFTFTKSVGIGVASPGWLGQAPLEPGHNGDLGGYAVAASGSTVMMGAPGYTVGGNVGQGMVQIATVTPVHCSTPTSCQVG